MTIRDIARMKAFLTDLNVPVPNNIPPFSVSYLKGGSGFILTQNVSLSYFAVRPADIHDRMVMTALYVNYVFYRPFTQVRENSTMFASDPRPAGSIILSEYLNWSFWNRVASQVESPWVPVLWDIRLRLGKDFTDRLAVAAEREMILSTPPLQRFGAEVTPPAVPLGSFDFEEKLDQESKAAPATSTSQFDASGRAYFLSALKRAAWEVSSNEQSWTTIQEVVRNRGM